MGMLIRVAFNNQSWRGRCKNADRDTRLFKCQEGVVDVGYKLDANGNCIANCWESTLCTKHFWGNPLGNFGQRASGNVFFVFPHHIDNSLILWGKSEVDKVEGNRIYFKKFEAMPSQKWVRFPSAKDILGIPWGQGTYRYLNKDQEDFLLAKIAASTRDR